MPAKDAPRIEILLAHCRSHPLRSLHLHVIGSIYGIDVDVGSRRFHELKQTDSSLAYLSSESFNIQVKGVLYFKLTTVPMLLV